MSLRFALTLVVIGIASAFTSASRGACSFVCNGFTGLRTPGGSCYLFPETKYLNVWTTDADEGTYAASGPRIKRHPCMVCPNGCHGGGNVNEEITPDLCNMQAYGLQDQDKCEPDQ